VPARSRLATSGTIASGTSMARAASVTATQIALRLRTRSISTTAGSCAICAKNGMADNRPI
jgi:hypothetical protein